SQVGFLWTTKPLEPNLDRLNPLSGLKRLFSYDGIFELFKAIVKFVIVGILTYILLSKWVKSAGALWDLEAQQLGLYIGKKVIHILLAVGVGMLLLSGVDYLFKRFRYEQRIKMTRQEAKDDRKKTEGNPQIRA